MKISLRRAPLVCVIACWSASGAAAGPDSITLREALDFTAARNPALVAFESQASAAREEAAIQALAPSPVIELQFENFAGTGDLSGATALESTLQLSKVVELGGKADARRMLGDSQLDKLASEQGAQRIDAVAEVARRFVEVLADQERLAAFERSVSLAEETTRAVRTRVQAGAASPVQSSRAEIALARARIEAEHAEHELRGSRVALSVQWGEIDPQFAEVRGSLFRLDDPEPFDRYAQRIENNPALGTFASGQRVLEARARLAQSMRRPSLTFNVGIRRLEAVDDAALVAGVAMPFGGSRRADGELRAVAAERTTLTLKQQAHRLDVHSTLFGVYQELTHARAEALALRERIRPQAQQMLETTEAGYRAGRFSFLELADAQRQLLEIDLDAIQAAAQFHLQLIEVERLTGQSMLTLAEGSTP